MRNTCRFLAIAFLFTFLTAGCGSSSDQAFEEPDQSEWTEPKNGGEPELLEDGP